MGAVREGLSEEVVFEQRAETRRSSPQGGEHFRGNSKWKVPEPGQNCAWHVGRTVRKPLWFEPREERRERGRSEGQEVSSGRGSDGGTWRGLQGLSFSLVWSGCTTQTEPSKCVQDIFH